jgi:DNA-binding CsgD family transcriptional regulator
MVSRSENTFTADEVEILAALNGETEAWLRRDLEALAEYWVQSPTTRRMSSVAHHGTQVQEGWDAIYATLKSLAEQYPETYSESRVRTERLNIVVNQDTAWVTYDQIGEKSDDSFEMVGTQHELKIFHRIDGKWKIACIVVMQRAIDHEVSPLIEISSNKTVLWMNGYAHEQINDHPFLSISGGRLRARNHSYEGELQAVVDWASRHLHWNTPPSETGRHARAVILGENDEGAPQFCWVLIQDGKIMVSFNDNQMVKRRVLLAQNLYRLTNAQSELAQLLVMGKDLSGIAENLGVSVNTVRTHLQRMFDKTGVRSQSALVGILLSAGASNIV